MDLVRLLAKLAPFGMSNKKPIFALQDVTCSATRPLGKEGKHSRIMVLDSTQSIAFECVMWNSRGRIPQDAISIDIAFTAEINSFNGRDRLQLVLADWRLSPRSGLTTAAQEEHTTGTAADGSLVPYLDAATTSSTATAGGAQTYQHVARTTAKPTPLQEVVKGVVSQNPKAREQEMQHLAEKVKASDELLNRPGRLNTPRVQSIASVKYVWKDLREHAQPLEIVNRARQKLASAVAIFGESCTLLDNIKFCDRTSIVDMQHLILWQMPPSAKVFQEILSRNSGCNIYLLGTDASECDEPSGFLKRMYGLIRYAVNKKDGQIEGEKLAAKLGASKMSVALGLTVLRRVNLIDWFSEDGCIFLELLGAADREADELAEYKQLSNSLTTTKEFRAWCSSARLDDIQLAVTPNHVGAAPETARETLGADMRDED
jgi:hypothetical protein